MAQVIPIGRVKLNPLPGLDVHDLQVERTGASKFVITHRIELDQAKLGEVALQRLLAMYDHCCGPKQMRKIMEILELFENVSRIAGSTADDAGEGPMPR